MAKRRKTSNPPAAGGGKAADQNPARDRPQRRNAERLLGQMMFAIGAGASGVHISREAVGRMRARYAEHTFQFVAKPNWDSTWNRFGIYTLRWFTTIGRTAADLATEAGSPVIDGSIFEQARIRVEATYREHLKRLADGGSDADGGTTDVQVRGDICPDPFPEDPPDDGD
jgi:hypothetical protein